MDSDQTGFSSSSPPTSVVVAAAGHSSNGSSDDGTTRVTPPNTPGVNRTVVKDEPEDGATVETLPSISEENWRAYYQQPLVAVMNGNDEHGISAIYETYKLPSLAKFGKGFVGRLPAIWSVAVTSTDGTTLLSVEDETITPDSPAARSPSQPSDLSAATLYIREAEKSDRDDVRTVIQATPEHLEVVKANGTEEKEALPMAPTAVEVKQPEEENTNEIGSDSVPGREIQAETSQADLPLESATYPTAEFSPSPYEPLGTGQYSVLTNVVVTAAPPQYATHTPAGVYTLTTSDYYREFYTPAAVTQVVTVDQYQQQAQQQQTQQQQQQVSVVRQQLVPATVAAYADGVDSNAAYVERYIRQNYKTSQAQHGISVDLPSPDSGIGETTVTPRDSLQQIFDYTELAQTTPLLPTSEEQTVPGTTSSTTPVTSSPPVRKSSWSSEFGRNAESDKVQIPKVFSEVGFHYFLETPISTSQRREDDRMTYINKGQYYGITLEYIPDPDRPLRTCTVKSVVMLVFREEKSSEDELKAWKFWHGRQHSVKQRILDADTKNSCGIIGQIEEVTHNAISFYWNPMEGPAKISISVHCLSTDFSNQKGVKGLPLHVQVDTFDDFREGALPVHRGYCQIKVFCDKGAERKTRDEERRAAKRKLTATGNSRKKIEEMYHPPCERSEFYSMSDLAKPPVLFTPVEDTEKPNGPELTFYTISATPSEEATSVGDVEVKPPIEIAIPPPKKLKLIPPERVLLYAKRQEEEVFHPLHLVPPSLVGLANAIEAKYNISSDLIRNLYKRCKKGITVEMDDDIVRHYCNEDTFIIDIIKTEDGKYDVTLVEL